MVIPQQSECCFIERRQARVTFALKRHLSSELENRIKVKLLGKSVKDGLPRTKDRARYLDRKAQLIGFLRPRT